MCKPIRTLVLGLVMVAGLAACNDSGEIKFHKRGDGQQVTDGKLVFTSLVVQLAPDSVLYDSRESNFPAQPLTYIDSLAEMHPFVAFFGKLRVGDSATLRMSVLDYYKPPMSPMPGNLDSSDVLIFSVGVDSVVDREEMMARQRQMQIDRVMQYRAAMLADSAVQAQMAIEDKIINDYMAKNGLTADTTKNGVRVVITEMGTGYVAEPGDIMGMLYAGSLLDGTYFDTNLEEIAKAEDLYNPNRPYGDPYEFPLVIGQVIQGWHVGIQGLPVGTKATLLIPSPLGYGTQGSRDVIPANAPLRFDVEVVTARSPE